MIRSGKAATVEDFIDWLAAEGLFICENVKGGTTGSGKPFYRWEPDSRQPEQLMADHFGIDRDKIETERRMLLARLHSGEGSCGGSAAPWSETQAGVVASFDSESGTSSGS